MSAWHKALKNVWKSDPYISCWVDCTHCDGSRGPGLAVFEVSEYCLTKLELIKGAKAQGWTWDKDGNWLCPVCSKEGE